MTALVGADESDSQSGLLARVLGGALGGVILIVVFSIAFVAMSITIVGLCWECASMHPNYPQRVRLLYWVAGPAALGLASLLSFPLVHWAMRPNPEGLSPREPGSG